jgi:hypothetical protein
MTDWFARPVLHVTDVEASLRFYVSPLGFTSPWRYEEDGRARQLHGRGRRKWGPSVLGQTSLHSPKHRAPVPQEEIPSLNPGRYCPSR